MELSREGRMRRNLTLTSVSRIAGVGMAVPIPTIVGYWQQHGLSATEINALQAIFAVALIAFEVVSSYVADRCVRKWVIVIGDLVNIAGATVYGLASSFEGFAAAEILLAFGMALISGTDEALFHDSLEELGQKGEFSHRWGRTSWQQHWAMAVGTLAGGFIAAVEIRATFAVAAMCYGVALISSAMLTEPGRIRPERTAGHLNEVKNIFVQCFVRVDSLRWLLIYGALVFSLMQPTVWWYQPYLINSGWQVQYIGIAFCIISIVAGVAARNATRVRNRLGTRGALVAVMLLIALSFLALGTFTGAWTAVLILVHQLARGANGVLLPGEIHPRIDSGYRATVVSLFGSVQRLCYSVVLIPCGLIVDRWGVATGFMVLGTTLLLAAVVLTRTMPLSLSKAS